MKDNQLFVESATQLRQWLEENHALSKGIWLVFYKGDKRTITVDEIIDQILCFGWIDSKPGKVDEQRTKIYISPRSPKSNWSAVNKQKVARLIKDGLMTPTGMALIDLAKKTGTWDALNQVDNLIVPDDLLKELDKYSDAKSNFEQFPRSVKRGILEWIFNAKKPETRHKRIEETAHMAQNNFRANQWPQ